MSNNKKFFISATIISLIVFISSYLLYMGKSKCDKQCKDLNKNSDIIMSNVKFDNVVNKDTQLIFITEYIKSGQKEVVKKIAGIEYKDIIGYDKEKLSEKFLDEGYKIENMNNSVITFIRRLNTYSPNKYVIGLKKIDNQEYLAIFKTDEQGNMYIEDYANDITDIKANMLRAGDLDILRNGCKDLQFDNKNLAKEAITEYES